MASVLSCNGVHRTKNVRYVLQDIKRIRTIGTNQNALEAFDLEMEVSNCIWDVF